MWYGSYSTIYIYSVAIGEGAVVSISCKMYVTLLLLLLLLLLFWGVGKSLLDLGRSLLDLWKTKYLGVGLFRSLWNCASIQTFAGILEQISKYLWFSLRFLSELQLRDHTFSVYATFLEKLIFLIPWYAYPIVLLSG